MELRFVDYAILGIYSVFVLAVGFAQGRMRTSEDFFLSGRSLPSWVTGLAFIAANLGALEVMGMAANGAKYGMLTNHFYWMGAIPAMVFLAIFMMPFYYGSRVRSVPEYLKLRFDERTRGLNAISFAVMTVAMSGINMYAMALVMNLMLGWNIHASILLSAAIVLVYIFFGGLTSSIYNEVLQFFLIVFGLLPMAILGLTEVGGFDGLAARLPEGFAHTWSVLSDPAENPMGVGFFGTIMGSDSFCPSATGARISSWSKGRSPRKILAAAQRTPLIAAIPKMLFPLLVILPGLVALATIPEEVGDNYNMSFPLMLARYYPPGLLGLGLTALLASFMSGMAGNVTAFNTVWTYDIYQAYLRPGRPTRTISPSGKRPRSSGLSRASPPRTWCSSSTTSWTTCSSCSRSSTLRSSRRFSSGCSGRGQRRPELSSGSSRERLPRRRTTSSWSRAFFPIEATWRRTTTAPSPPGRSVSSSPSR